jgi:membrane protease YdiL (CAAX protease family)
MAPSDLETAFILLIVPVVLLIWVYYGKRTAFERFFARRPEHRQSDVYGVLYEYAAAFVLMFVAPFVVMTLGFRVAPCEIGLQPGNVRLGGRILGFGVPLALLAAWMGAARPAMQAEYPLAKSIKGAPRQFLLVEAFYFFYYVGWEFLFRGLMLFGLSQQYGALLAVLVQTIPSALVHIGKPATESFASIVAGVLFGYVALETRSIVYPVVLHAVVGIATDVFVTVRTRQAR